MNMFIETNKFLADILIVDDKLENIRFLSDFLSTQQYQVRKAISGQAALTASRTIPPDLILLDINMPGMDGYEVCKQLKNDSKTNSIPIIFLSAGNDLSDKVRAFQVGGIDYITKPFQLEEVLVRVQTQLTICELRQKLEDQNAQLNQALESLKKAQENLVQQEKMAALRKVVAGVAHEINNPLGFIAGNIKPVQEYVTSLLSLIELYQQKYGSNIDPDIAAFIEAIDLEFITADLKNTIHSMENGAERIRTVILALRIFTRLDESGIKQVSVHGSIESALTLLQHRFNSRQDGAIIQITKEYGELPLITGYADQLNQVFFNLLCNAIDAIDEKIDKHLYANETPEILIHTQLIDDGHVMISIKDNGIGISEANKSDIFEPFFTTKSAGYGVGLGLATSRRIIEEIHHGQLSYRSSMNEGSDFLIQLPT